MQKSDPSRMGHFPLTTVRLRLLLKMFVGSIWDGKGPGPSSFRAQGPGRAQGHGSKAVVEKPLPVGGEDASPQMGMPKMSLKKV